jgi:uncharacterized protein YndB with AHSA1/START domain
MSYDWSQFSQWIKIKAPAQAVYDLWATRRGIESWFLRMGEFSRNGDVIGDDEPVAAGDTYRWRWHGYPDSITETGEVLQANGKDRFSFVFGKAGIVTVDVEDTGNGTSKMTITQSQIPTTEEGKQNYHVGCSTGWTFYRCNMKAVVEGGVDIRNKDNNDDMND